VVEQEGVVVAPESNTGFNIKVVKPPMFNRDTSKILDFIIVYRIRNTAD